MTTITTLLSGGEGVGLGARAAGLTHLEGFELEDAIASVARLNGFNVHTDNLFDIDPSTLTVPDVLHASPVCTNASVANQSAELNEVGSKETLLDVAMGEKVAQFIDVMRPKCFTLENVMQYATAIGLDGKKGFLAFRTICAALNRNGYFWDYDNLNSADYAVPQTRRRLILRAVRGSLLPMLPQPERWIGWYSAIADLIPTLPNSQFAPWQLARLPELTKSTLVSNAGNQPNGYEERQPVQVGILEPVPSVTGQFEGRVRAFILDCQKAGNANGERGVTLPQGDAPVFTITAGKQGRQPVRAYLVSDFNSDLRSKGEPSFTLRAFDTGGAAPRAWLSQGRVVKMTARALARFQSFPDSYEFSGNNRLDCKIIGNSVPPLLYQKIIAPLVEVTR